MSPRRPARLLVLLAGLWLAASASAGSVLHGLPGCDHGEVGESAGIGFAASASPCPVCEFLAQSGEEATRWAPAVSGRSEPGDDASPCGVFPARVRVPGLGRAPPTCR